MMDMRVFETAQRLAKEYKAPAAHVAAVIQVESAGVYDPCQIRWEGHYFYRLLSGAKRDAAVKAGLAHPKAGKVGNPRSQDARYALLHKAMEIDAEAAISSTSFGVGQVMGAHWKVLGYASAEALRQEAMTGLYGQARLMMRYIVKFGLLDELQEGQWAAFARGYNGPGYRTNRYDEKLAKAAAAFGGRTAVPDGMLRLGAKGARVRELQALLVRVGEPVKIDGDFGQTTRDAVRRLQKRHGLAVDGVAGPETMAAFTSYRTSPDEKLGARRLIDMPHFGKVAGSVLGAGGLAEAKDQLENAAAQVGGLAGHLTSLPSLAGYAEAAASGLVAVAAVVGVAALAYGAWQWVSAGRTYEGVPA